ncbi:MAG: hypothetical protein PHV16_04885 [Candidatus Nanoarchaeia archaeon]|nr:hypothetical protein [Candidatus Nanoarchaeia archaeon]
MPKFAELQNIQSQVKPIKNYVTTCLDDATKKGLLLIGMQGGYINLSDGGQIILNDENSIPYEDNYGNIYRVYYAITKQDSNNFNFYFHNPWKYPWEKFPYVYSGGSKEINYKAEFFNIFGKNNLPPLEGPEDNSIEYQLKGYITKYLNENINLTVFKDMGFEIKEGKKNVSVLIEENNVVVVLEYPLSIEKKAEKILTNITYFYTVSDVRLKKIYSIVDDSIHEDIFDISFDITNIDILDNYIENCFNIERIRIERGHDDIIIINDSESILYGEPYKFQFARENRFPALHYIPDDITIMDISKINLKANDPDEDELSFSYSGSIVYVSDGELEDYQDLGITITGTILD